LEHKEADRIPISDSPWRATISRWRREGLPEEIPVEEYFGYEMVGMGFDSTPRFPVEVLEKTESYIIERTSTGAINKNFRDYSTTPQLLERPIKEKKDWPPIKERLYPDYTRVNWVSAFNTYHRARSEGKFITVNSGWGL